MRPPLSAHATEIAEIEAQEAEAFASAEVDDAAFCQSAWKGGSGAKLVQLVMNPE